ncbi:MAG TPA: dephospho-CoA kinase [Ruminococcaceae bacterium]|nr:dephospho-CoA kinase [Oscillospiraceae bacterium]HBQ46097.1 dephospho-CoA kinase [Oscillospiraceae bacterium]HBT91081.1 dephospho-CoA kinase [Oscillospiraceae bacterium]HCB90733.1 dephospho-CoA kinase [Oscillospiraceae bacterium]
MDKPVIGLTGPTGAGKSTVAAVFRRLGCAVIDADRIARSAVETPACLARLRAAFGPDVAPGGALDRGELARRAFASPQATALLNAITHPAVIAESKRRIAGAREGACRAVVVDAPLLFESGAQTLCTVTVAVTAPEEKRLARILRRDGISEQAARERMGAQHGAEYYTRRADYALDGGRERAAVERAAARLLERILGGRDDTGTD